MTTTAEPFTRTRRRTRHAVVTPADPRVAELHAALADERYRPFWPDLHDELVALTATSVLSA